MNTEEMLLTILNRMDSIEAGMTGLNGRMDRLETSLNDKMDELKGSLDSKILKLEVDAIMELFLVRREIYGRIKSLEKEAGVYRSEDDNSVYAREAEEIHTCLRAIEKIYRELKEKIG